MRARLERFFLNEWQRASAWQLLLQPLSWLYAAIMQLRRVFFGFGLFRVIAAPVPVIVVGNITVGGTGKTPVVLALAEHFTSRQIAPGIVTRGYQASNPHAPPGMVMHVVPAQPRVNAVSDEALLLRQRTRAPVFADKNRPRAIAALLAKHADTKVIISDDGLQRTAMARDIEIVVIDGTRGLGNGHLLPAGPLRESATRLQSVDCIIFNNTNIDEHLQANFPENARQIRAFTNNVPTFAMTYGAETFSFINKNSAPSLTLAEFLDISNAKKIAAMAGIGNPQRFFDHLMRLGITLASTHAKPDHHVYTRDDLAAINADIILMTEKDAVKCASFTDTRLMQMQVSALLPDAFYKFIDEKFNHVTRSKTT